MQTPVKNQTENTPIKEAWIKYQQNKSYLISKYVNVLICGSCCALMLLCYSISKKTLYTALCTLVMEDTKTSQLSQYSDVATIAEYNMSGVAGNGIFADDNILELFKSRTMIIKALFSNITVNGNKELLINRYINSFGLRKEWDSKGIAKIEFNSESNVHSRQQDSIIIDIVKNINKTILTVTKPDKKLTIVDVQVKASDEIFAKEFNDKLVENVSSFFVNTKTKRSLENLNLLQLQVDSIRQLLHFSVGGVAFATDAIPFANPTKIKLKIPSQNKQIDVQANTTIYTEMVKNVELAKIALRHEMPLIQIIDGPMYPLEIEKFGKIKALIVGFTVGIFLCSVFLLLKRNIMLLLE